MRTESENRLEDRLEELAGLMDRGVAPGQTTFESDPVWISRQVGPTPSFPALYKPMLCVVAQGRKEVCLGQQRTVYERGQYLLNTVTVPATGRILDATEAQPCLSVTIELDPVLVQDVALEASVRPPASRLTTSMTSGKGDPPLIAAVVQLVQKQIAHEPQYLRNLALRELIFRLLVGSQSARMFQLAAYTIPMQQVVRATEWIRGHFAKPFPVTSLAERVGMSVSSLHHQFKLVTGMSPLQFQKQLRLQEARRLMVGEGMDVAGAGYRVGYEDPAYFSRDYRQFFGTAPKRHVQIHRRQG